MIRSDGNSWDTKLIAAGATHAAIIEPTTQYATASIAVYSSAGGTLRIYRGSTADSVILVESMPLPAGGASTFIVPAIESHFQVRLGLKLLVVCEGRKAGQGAAGHLVLIRSLGGEKAPGRD